MANARTESGNTITIGERLRRKPALVSKVRRLDDTLVEIFGEKTPIDWELSGEEPENWLSLHVGAPGTGECTRYPPESLLETTSELKSILLNMKECLQVVQQYLSELEQLYQQIRSWLSQARPAYQVEEAPTTVEEALTGKYSAKKLLIRLKRKEVEVLPRGAWWITTQGRVDLVGEDDYEHQLILSRPEGGWLWVEERPRVALHPLTAELFIKLVKDCMG
jgi:hypothetical protein